MSPVRVSYAKSTGACSAAVLVGVIGALIALAWLPTGVRIVVALLFALVVIVAATFACAGATVLKRHSRSTRGHRDLFLELNRSREAAAIRSAPLPEATRLRAINVPRLVADCGKLRAQTGWRAEISLEHSLADVLEYWRVQVQTGATDPTPLELRADLLRPPA